jgi:hypothetical protein
MLEMGTHMTDIKSISDDSCRHWGNSEQKSDEATRFLAELLLADR